MEASLTIASVPGDKKSACLHPRAGCIDGFHECLLLWIWLPSFIWKAKKPMVSDWYHPFFKSVLFLKIGGSLFSTPGNWWSLLYYFLKFFLAQRAHNSSLCKAIRANAQNIGKQTWDQTTQSSEMNKQFRPWRTQLKKTTRGSCVDHLGFSCVAWT